MIGDKPTQNHGGIGRTAMASGIGGAIATGVTRLRHHEIYGEVVALDEIEDRLMSLVSRINPVPESDNCKSEAYDNEPSFQEVLNGTAGNLRGRRERLNNLITTLEDQLF